MIYNAGALNPLVEMHSRRNFLKTLLGIAAAPLAVAKACERHANERAMIDSMGAFQKAVFDAFDEANVDVYRVPEYKTDISLPPDYQISIDTLTYIKREIEKQSFYVPRDMIHDGSGWRSAEECGIKFAR